MLKSWKTTAVIRKDHHVLQYYTIIRHHDFLLEAIFANAGLVDEIAVNIINK